MPTPSEAGPGALVTDGAGYRATGWRRIWTRPQGRLARPDLAGLLEAERDRLFLWSPVAFGLGIATYFALPAEPPLAAVLILVTLAGLSLWCLISAGPLRLVAIGALVAALGFADAKLRSLMVAAPVVESQTGVVSITGRVESFQPRPDGASRLILVPDSVESLEPDATPARLSLTVRVRDAEAEPGGHVEVRGVLMPPPDAARPGGFDYARQAWFERLGATGYAVSAPEPIAGPERLPASVRLSVAVERLRSAIAQRIAAQIEGEAGGIAAALVTGYRGGIPDDAQEALRAAGLAHILAISGLHMMLVVGTLFWAARGLLALSPTLALTRPIKKWAAVVALAGGAAYLVISGAFIATQRAYIMAAIMLIAVLADRPAITLRNVAIAALIVLALTPEALLSASFQMSFAATAALVAGYEAIREARPPGAWDGGGWLSHLRRHLGRYVFALVTTALIAGIATAPYAAFHFNRIAVYGLIGNIGAMPLVGTLVMPFGLLGMCLMPFGLDGPFLRVMGVGIDAVLYVARTVASWGGAVSFTPAFSVLALGLMTLGGLWLMLWRRSWRLWGLAGIVAGLALAAATPRPDLYISRDAGMAALRLDDGSLVFMRRASSGYVAERWLRAAGSAQPPGDSSLTEGRRCDDHACIAQSTRLSVALVDHPAAFADECRLADVVVARVTPPAWCAEHALVYGPEEAERSGAATIRVSGGRLMLDTVGGRAGGRPWSRRGAAAE